MSSLNTVIRIGKKTAVCLMKMNTQTHHFKRTIQTNINRLNQLETSQSYVTLLPLVLLYTTDYSHVTPVFVSFFCPNICISVCNSFCLFFLHRALLWIEGFVSFNFFVQEIIQWKQMFSSCVEIRSIKLIFIWHFKCFRWFKTSFEWNHAIYYDT